MGAYILRRLIIAVLLVLIAASLIFLMLRVVPGDVVDTMLSESGATEEQVQAMRHAMGLDRPLTTQYLAWLGGLARGDLGKSLVSGRPIAPDLALTFPRTLELIAAATFVAWLVGVPAGVYAASRNNTPPDLLVSSTALVGLSAPSFVRGTLLILIFALWLRWFPASGFVPLAENPLDHLRLILLPALAIGIALSGSLMRMTRGTLLEVLQQDFIRTARSKGLRERMVQYRHALRNALIPVVTASGLQMGELLGGTVVIEYVFNYPGMSTMMITAVHRRDYPVVQATLLFTGITFILINLMVDVVNAYLDPRIRYR